MAFTKLVLVILLAGLCGIEAQSGDILSVLDRTNGLRKFRSWCEPIKHFYSGTGTLTVFAFNDSSYNSMPATQRARLAVIDGDQQLQQEYVQTYTVLSRLSMTDLAPDVSYDGSKEGLYTSANGNKIFTAERIFREWGTGTSTGIAYSYVNGARILGQPITASNGLLYVLDRPPDLPSRENVYQWILRNGDGSGVQTSTFARLMQRLYSEYYTSAIAPISANTKITFFLPSEKALSEIPQEEFDKLSDAELANYFRMHYVPGKVLYTSFVNHQESAQSGFTSNVLFLRNNEKVVVKSGDVTASIIQGNITVSNGVIHLIDTMFGLVYQTSVQRIMKESSSFGQLLGNLDPNMESKLQQQGMNMFVPTNEALMQIRNIVNYQQNRTVANYIIVLGMIKDGSIEVSQLNGNYDVRQHRMSWYNNQRLVIYNDRNETWVNGGHVRAKIVKPDIKTTNGRIQLIDAVLGIPSMDIPHLIYYDDYLLLTYYELRSVGLVDYLRDPRFSNSSLPPRNFDRFGNGQDLYSGLYPTTMNPYANQYTTQYPYPNNQYPNNQYPNNQYPSNQYPSNQYPQNQQVAQYGRCRDFSNVCQFTYFIPNGSAIFNYKMTSYGRQISLDPDRYRYILRRTLLLDQLVYLDEMAPSQTDHMYTTHTGETISLRKETDTLVRISWSSEGAAGEMMSARVIMWDLGATNGVVHIIENVLSVSSDLNLDMNMTSGTTSSTATVSTATNITSSITSLGKATNITSSTATVAMTTSIISSTTTVDMATSRTSSITTDDMATSFTSSTSTDDMATSSTSSITTDDMATKNTSSIATVDIATNITSTIETVDMATSITSPKAIIAIFSVVAFVCKLLQ